MNKISIEELNSVIDKATILLLMLHPELIDDQEALAHHVTNIVLGYLEKKGLTPDDLPIADMQMAVNGDNPNINVV